MNSVAGGRTSAGAGSVVGNSGDVLGTVVVGVAVVVVAGAVVSSSPQPVSSSDNDTAAIAEMAFRECAIRMSAPVENRNGSRRVGVNVTPDRSGGAGVLYSNESIVEWPPPASIVLSSV